MVPARSGGRIRPGTTPAGGIRAQLRGRRPRHRPARQDRGTRGCAATLPTARRLSKGVSMDPSRLTQKSQEALHDAQARALRYGHPAADGEHLLLALLDQPDGIVPRLLLQAGADPGRLRNALEAGLERPPRVSGPGAAPREVSVPHRLSRRPAPAQDESGPLKDESGSVEHPLIGLAGVWHAQSS